MYMHTCVCLYIYIYIYIYIYELLVTSVSPHSAPRCSSSLYGSSAESQNP